MVVVVSWRVVSVFVFSGLIFIVCSVHLVLVATFAALVFLPPTAGGLVVRMFYEDVTCVRRNISRANRNRNRCREYRNAQIVVAQILVEAKGRDRFDEHCR